MSEHVQAAPILIEAGKSENGWSTIGDILFCPQLYAWARLDEQTGVTDTSTKERALLFGSLLHVMLAHYYAAYLYDEKIYLPPATALRAYAEKEGIKDELLLDDVEEVFDLYREEAFTEDQGLQILGVEKLLMDTLHEQNVSMRADLIARFRGRVYLIDHKTTSKISASTQMKYVLSGQFQLAQWMMERAYGEEFGGIIINAICSKPETVGLKHYRMMLSDAPSMRVSFEANMRWAFRIRQSLSSLPLSEYPRVMNEKACITQYGPCKYFARCKNG